MPKLYLVRHAEPELRGVVLGHTDTPLSDAGRMCANAIRVPAALVFCSPLLRARQTATCLTPAPVIVEELREISYGDWDGRAWADIERSHPELARRKAADWRGVTPPGGEPWQEFEKRVRRALLAIRGSGAECTVVAHLGVNSVIHAALTGMDALGFRQRYCEVLEYEL
ncbi:MAG: histidine phosphatase family protein [Bryobacteraceae bacterium]|nr:histidine phosphatase family protein [Bryobacteraceae bacterium]